MAVSFAKGKRAFGYCDRCNQRYDLKELKPEFVAGKPTNVRCCPQCFDKDHPQNFIGRIPVNDPQALRDPRPDPSLDASRVLWGWNPVGNPAIEASGRVGVITLRLNGTLSPVGYLGDN